MDIEHSGLVVEYLIWNWGITGLSHTRGPVLCNCTRPFAVPVTRKGKWGGDGGGGADVDDAPAPAC